MKRFTSRRAARLCSLVNSITFGVKLCTMSPNMKLMKENVVH